MSRDRHFAGLPGCEGNWKKLGKLQLNYLLDNGLENHHYLLDIGCGTFRGGRLFLDYLDKGHYYGIDRNPNLLLRGIERVLAPSKLILKRPVLYSVELGLENIDIRAVLGKGNFDYIWAHAVFDHMKPEYVSLALDDLSVVLSQDSSLYATSFIVDSSEYDMPASWGSGDNEIMTFPDREYWHYTIDFFSSVAMKIGFELVDCPKYEHPLGLSMLKFVKV